MNIRIAPRFLTSFKNILNTLYHKNNTVINPNNCKKCQDKPIRSKNSKLLGATESHNNPIEISKYEKTKSSKDELSHLFKFNDFFV